MNTKIYLSRPELFPFIYPGYRRIYTTNDMSRSGKVYYEIEKKDKIVDIDRIMSHTFGDYLILTPNESHVVDTAIREDMEFINFVAAIKVLKITKTLEKNLKTITSEEFSQFVKISLVLGRWYHELFEKHEKVYELFEALKSSKESLVERYFQLRKKLSPEELLSAILTFLLKLKNKENLRNSISDYYLELLGAVEKIIKVENVPSVLSELIRIKSNVPVDSRVVHFLLALRK